MREVLVAGIGSTSFGRHPDMDFQTLVIRAADAAIRDTGMARSEVGGLYPRQLRRRRADRAGFA